MCAGVQELRWTLFVITTLLLSAIRQAWSQPIVELRMHPTGIIRQGDNVTIECSVSPFNAALLDLLRVSHISNGKEHEISTNSFMVPAFSSTGRYHISWLPDSSLSTATIQIQITGIKSEDGGEISCEKLNSATSARESLVVYVPAKDVTIYQVRNDVRNPLTDGILRLQESESSTVECDVTVEGGQSEPNVLIYMGTTDIIPQCKKNVVNSDSPTDIGTIRKDMHITYKCNIVNPLRRDNGNNFSCIAYMTRVNEKGESVAIQVEYPPIITCQKIAHAKPNTANFVISCNIAMVPNPTNGFWNWTDPNGDEMKLPLRGEIENLTAYFEEHQPPKQMVASLVFDTMTPDMFGTYTLTVSNHLGTASADIAIVNDTSHHSNGQSQTNGKWNNLDADVVRGQDRSTAWILCHSISLFFITMIIPSLLSH